MRVYVEAQDQKQAEEIQALVAASLYSSVNPARFAREPEPDRVCCCPVGKHGVKTMPTNVTAAVIGLGYVGLPLAIRMVNAGLSVIGIDVDANKVHSLCAGESYIADIPSNVLGEALSTGRFSVTSDFSVLQQVDAVSICVPTPLRKTKDPDLSYIASAVSEIAKYLHLGQIVILESTTYPGTTDELVLDELAQTGLNVGKDFFLAFSPERIDPGNQRFTVENTPKVIGGVTPTCTTNAAAFYRLFLPNVIEVSNARVAEMVKLMENTFRAVNIALVNEMALLSDRMGIDIWEVIDAAATKPFGFMPFYPGPGIGGHCIPLDPLYLSWKAKTFDFYHRFIELASEVNSGMPRFVVNKVADVLNQSGKAVRGSKIVLMGLSYKRDVEDLRESPALEIFELLRENGANVVCTDPHVRSFRNNQDELVSTMELTPQIVGEADLVLLVTDHSAYDYQMVADHAPLILDTRNAFKGVEGGRVIKLGTGVPKLELV